MVRFEANPTTDKWTGERVVKRCLDHRPSVVFTATFEHLNSFSHVLLWSLFHGQFEPFQWFFSLPLHTHVKLHVTLWPYRLVSIHSLRLLTIIHDPVPSAVTPSSYTSHPFTLGTSSGKCATIHETNSRSSSALFSPFQSQFALLHFPTVASVFCLPTTLPPSLHLPSSLNPHPVLHTRIPSPSFAHNLLWCR